MIPMNEAINKNKRFGHWQIIAPGYKTGYVLCRCDCGTEREVLYINLAYGRSRSCGCSANRVKELTNEETKKKHIIRKLDDNKYECRCTKCGTIFIATRTQAKWKNTCGCNLRKTAIKVGDVINDYEVIKILPPLSNKKRAEVKCVYCGEMRILRTSFLRNGKAVCRCRKANRNEQKEE